MEVLAEAAGEQSACRVWAGARWRPRRMHDAAHQSCLVGDGDAAEIQGYSAVSVACVLFGETKSSSLPSPPSFGFVMTLPLLRF